MAPNTKLWESLITAAIEEQRKEYAERFYTHTSIWAYKIAEAGGDDPGQWKDIATQVAERMTTSEYQVTVKTDLHFQLGTGFSLQRLPSPDEQKMMSQWLALLRSEIHNAGKNNVVHYTIGDQQLTQNGCSPIPRTRNEMVINAVSPLCITYHGSPWAYEVAKQLARESPDYDVYIRSDYPDYQSGDYRFVLCRRELPLGFDTQAVVNKWVAHIQSVIARAPKDIVLQFIYADNLVRAGCRLIFDWSLGQQAVKQFEDSKYKVYTHTLDNYQGKAEDRYFVIQARELPPNFIVA